MLVLKFISVISIGNEVTVLLYKTVILSVNITASNSVVLTDIDPVICNVLQLRSIATFGLGGEPIAYNV